MINLNKSAIEIFTKEQDIVEVIRLLYIFSLAKEKNFQLHFNQYYKSLNLENGIFQIKQGQGENYYLNTNVLGFIGAFGTLPNQYTKRAALSARNSDYSLINFLDAFYNLVMQLFSEIIIHFDLLECTLHYAISETKYIPRTIANIFSIKGIKLLGYKGITSTCILKNISHFSVFSKPKVLLESLLSSIFLVKTKIIEFAKEKVTIKSLDNYSNGALGKDINLGEYCLEDNIYLRQEKIEIIFYDLDPKINQGFLETLKHKKNLLKQILESYLGNHIKYKLCLVFKSIEATYLKNLNPPNLGINTFLQS